MSLFISGNPPPPQRRRLFAAFVVLLGLAAAILLGLQHTPHALFKPEKTDTLWGLLTGIVLMGAFILFRWARGAGRGH